MQSYIHVLTARSRVLHAGKYLGQPALITDAWLQLKEQQGHPITVERLARIETGHPSAGPTMIAPPAPAMSMLARRRGPLPLFDFTPPDDGDYGGDAA
ncbi:hypothetical protein [Pseudooceanicola nanhaiensis]|uniref:hypothetical protein n=1 Tax=Pseudooceanicola nanhaiensis TaxID=375761 RepID=UPI001CD25842|nr:hypothetical protein [Pseudooceanicola nanhaiensis]MCA0919691.1 hypothetical protein [Pseudooceanicola nanhaiensis]